MPCVFQRIMSSTLGYNFKHCMDLKGNLTTKSRSDEKLNPKQKEGQNPCSWLCMELLHKEVFGIRLQLDELYEIARETPRNSVERKKNRSIF